ncbi:DNA end-binding protein Ku [Endobacter medicaginis]|uniref:Non-homologous end joining protein Ku n=1 Tax=Endobacter medicaginis TaxID=1181271 RepID=A0A839UUG6_9PROT|nr:Ku protein [Endobacter medicaginis]MBB3172315.1 DNA end-binding protein Ku [Endobacter medicaginis]MCX5474566.1 Ku protein [Endobacter medicaginis]NVN30984.1 Ku protein [Endobacter medicaginis]
MSRGPTRAIWRGQLRLALVSCPIALHPSRQASEGLHFHFINPATGNRVRNVTLDAQTDDELERRDLQRGYEIGRDRYVLLDDEDFEAARIETSSVLKIDKFVPTGSIDPIWFDTAYYLAPDGSGRDAADDVFVVLRDAIGKAEMAALSRLVIARRERAVAVMRLGEGMVLYTLHDAREVADPAALFDGLGRHKAEAEMVKLATQLVERQSGRFEPDDTEDRYQTRLREIIAAKAEGAEVTAPAAIEEDDNVVDLMAALRRSLGEDKPAKKRKARAKPARKAG